MNTDYKEAGQIPETTCLFSTSTFHCLQLVIIIKRVMCNKFINSNAFREQYHHTHAFAQTETWSAKKAIRIAQWRIVRPQCQRDCTPVKCCSVAAIISLESLFQAGIEFQVTSDSHAQRWIVAVAPLASNSSHPPAVCTCFYAHACVCVSARACTSVCACVYSSKRTYKRILVSNKTSPYDMF